MGLAKIVIEVMGKTFTRLDMVWNVGLRYLLVKSKSEVVDKGEEHFDEVGDRQVGVVALDRTPNPSSCAILVAPDSS